MSRVRVQRVSIVDVLDESSLGMAVMGGMHGIRGGARLLGLMLLYNGFGPLLV